MIDQSTLDRQRSGQKPTFRVVERSTPHGLLVKLVCQSRTGCQATHGIYERYMPEKPGRLAGSGKHAWVRSADGKFYCFDHRGEAK